MIFIIKDGHRQGPFSEEEAKGRLLRGEFTLDDLGWKEGTGDWVKLSLLLDIKLPPPVPPSNLPPIPPPLPPQPPVGSKPPPPPPINGPRPPPLVRGVPSGRRSILLWVALIAGVCVIAAVILLALLNSRPSSSGARVETALTSYFQSALDQDKQAIFDKIHPVGTAKEVAVDNLAITWKTLHPSDRVEDVQACTVDYTLSWSGPLREGHTKIREIYNVTNGSPKLTNRKIVSTSGITNQNAEEIASEVVNRTLNWLWNSLNSSPAPPSTP